MSRENIRSSLWKFVDTICRDKDGQSRLATHPREVFQRLGIAVPLVPDTGLAVNPETVSAHLTDTALYMPALKEPIGDVGIEMLLVSAGVKPLGLLHGSSKYLAQVLRWAEYSGLQGCFGPTEYKVIDEAGRNGYYNLAKDRRPSSGETSSMRTLFVSRSESMVILGYLSDLFGWDRYLGMLLGYPGCCVDKFIERWPEAVRKYDGDVAGPLVSASGRGPYDWRVNILSRYFGFELIQHFPCKFDCSNTIRLAKKYSVSLSQVEPNYVQTLSKKMKGLALYGYSEGVFLLRDIQGSPYSASWTYDPGSVVGSKGCNADTLDLLKRNHSVASNTQITWVGETPLPYRIVEFGNSLDRHGDVQ